MAHSTKRDVRAIVPLAGNEVVIGPHLCDLCWRAEPDVARVGMAGFRYACADCIEFMLEDLGL